MVTSGEVAKYIGELGIVKMPSSLKDMDIEHILDTIVADGKAERSESMEGTTLFRAVVPYFESAGLSRCFTTKIYEFCSAQPLYMQVTVWSMSSYFKMWRTGQCDPRNMHIFQRLA